MRGKPTVADVEDPSKRITPADAGKTHRWRLMQTSARDHPRGCGENYRYMFLRWSVSGSPPRMRGKRALAVGQIAGGRITPADAGKTLQTNVKQLPCKDHPRGCGENPLILMRQWMLTGSPPRMRGKLSLLRRHCTHHRITPADAGKTLSATRYFITLKDHPRGCGENVP